MFACETDQRSGRILLNCQGDRYVGRGELADGRGDLFIGQHMSAMFDLVQVETGQDCPVM